LILASPPPQGLSITSDMGESGRNERAQRPMDRANPNPVFLCKLGHRLALSIELRDLLLLAGIETLWSTKPLAKFPGSLDALITAGTDKVALELRNAPEDRQH
jgi:hypothetical protein